MTRSITRRLALLLLIYAAFDLCVPGFCQSEGVILPQAPTAATLSWHAAKGGTPSQTALDEDCFCCCIHLLHQSHSVLETPLSTVWAAPRLDFASLPGENIPHDHPPRA
jgi:hypothetical protein